MSALGQKQTCAPHQPMSALPPKADMCSATRDVRYGPKADIGYLFDHFVGAGEQRWRHGETKRLGGLKIDHQFVLGRCLHRKIGGLLALENAIDVAGCAPELVGEIRPIGDQTAVSNEESVEVDRG